MTANENQIVVYQPNETVRLDVRLENETVWLSQSQMATLFGCSSDNIGLHLKNVYAAGELVRESTTEDFSVVRMEGSRQVRRNWVVTLQSHVYEAVRRRMDAKRNCPSTTWTIAIHGKEWRCEMTWCSRFVAAAKMGAEVIPGLLASIRKATSERREYGKGKSKSRG